MDFRTFGNSGNVILLWLFDLLDLDPHCLDYLHDNFFDKYSFGKFGCLDTH